MNLRTLTFMRLGGAVVNIALDNVASWEIFTTDSGSPALGSVPGEKLRIYLKHKANQQGSYTGLVEDNPATCDLLRTLRD